MAIINGYDMSQLDMSQYGTKWKNRRTGSTHTPTTPTPTTPNPTTTTPTNTVPNVTPTNVPPAPVSTAGPAQVTPGSPQTAPALDQAAWQQSVGPMPTGGWTLKNGTKTTDAKKAWEDYKANYNPVPINSNEISVVDYAGQVATNPASGMAMDNPATPENESMFLSDRVEGIDENAAGTNVNPNDPKYAQQTGGGATQTTAATSQAAAVDPRTANTYTSQGTAGAIAQNQVQGAQGTVNPNAVVQNQDIDMQGMATGTNADGSVNWTGQALQEAATQDLNTVDDKATVKGQIAELQADFTGPNGEPKIPVWAAATARSVSKIAAFKGMTGTAATAALAQALMEASIPIAQQDAQFFQTLTLQNLSNKQQSTINRANVLAKMDEVNADNRLAAAIQNSKSFLEMDLRNLDNDQQARIVNNQNYVQSILEDAKAVNAERLFAAESQNDMDKFYDTLSSNISQFNANQSNQMAQFNAEEGNAISKFNADLENQREQFYKSMQYNIDTANAKWRQTVTLTESEQSFEAAATDVKNLVGLSVEQLNQLWDRSDSLLDYLWQSTEKSLDRKAALTLEGMRAEAAEEAADSAGWGSLFGSVAGSIAGSDQFLDFLF